MRQLTIIVQDVQILQQSFHLYNGSGTHMRLYSSYFTGASFQKRLM